MNHLLSGNRKLSVAVLVFNTISTTKTEYLRKLSGTKHRLLNTEQSKNERNGLYLLN